MKCSISSISYFFDSLNSTNRVIADRNLEIGEAKSEAKMARLELVQKEDEIVKIKSEQEIYVPVGSLDKISKDEIDHKLKIEDLEMEILALRKIIAEKEKLGLDVDAKNRLIEKLKLDTKNLETELGSHRDLLKEVGSKN